MTHKVVRRVNICNTAARVKTRKAGSNATRKMDRFGDRLRKR